MNGGSGLSHTAVIVQTSNLEFLVLDPAEWQSGSVVRRKDRLHHIEHISEKLLTLPPKPHPLPGPLESGHVTYGVNPRVR